MTFKDSSTDNTQQVYDAARRLWNEAQEGVTQVSLDHGLTVKGVPDVDIAELTGLELEEVREHLLALDGTQLAIRHHDRPALSVTAVLPQ